MADEIINIVILKDGDMVTCYPQTNGEAISVKVKTGGVQTKTMNLDEYLQGMFLNVPSNINAAANLTIDIGEESHRIGTIFVNVLNAKAVKTETVEASSSVTSPVIAAGEQLKVGSGVITQDPESGRLVPTTGIEGGVWN